MFDQHDWFAMTGSAGMRSDGSTPRPTRAQLAARAQAKALTPPRQPQGSPQKAPPRAAGQSTPAPARRALTAAEMRSAMGMAPKPTTLREALAYYSADTVREMQRRGELPQ